MSPPAMNPDRRRTPRVRPEGLAYINFEPDNGGIVLDISEDGLRFQSVAPVRTDDVIHLWFSAEGNRIAVEGRLAWIDEKRKTGGLQFNGLAEEARRQIHDWITQSAMPVAAEKKRATGVPAALPPVSVCDAVTKSRANAIATSGRAAWNMFLSWLRAQIRWTEFSRGLAAGLLVSAFVAAAFLFHMHRRQVGELLIHMGERFGATPQETLPSVPVHATAQQRSFVPEPLSKAAPLGKPPLTEQGFNARSLPRRSREFALLPPTNLPAGDQASEDFVVTWEAYGADATVKFVRGGDTVASGKGRWVKRASKYESDGVMYDRNKNGSRTLLEIWFRGMNQVEVFPTTSSEHPVIF